MEKTSNFVELKNINKIYGNNVQAVFDFNLNIKKHEFVVFVGPSGCGKSTTLRMIAGLEEISGGELYLDGVFANYLDSKKRNISMVFQNYALYPQMNVFDNMAYSLKIKRVPKDQIKKKVFEAARILNLGAYLDRYPRELSGGQMQRVALGRAIVKESNLFLMDEPLSNLDAKLRVQMRSEIVKLHKNIGATTIYVTHDQIEAMTMADVIVVMNKGYVQQIDSPEKIYNNPKNLFVATFIGTPPMNVVEGSIKDGNLLINEDLSIKLTKKEIGLIDKFYEEKIKEYEKYRDILNNKNIDKVANFVKKYSKKVTKTFADDLANLSVEVKSSENEINAELTKFLSRLENEGETASILNELDEKISSYKNMVRDGINKIKSSQTFVKKEEEQLNAPNKKKSKLALLRAKISRKNRVETIKNTELEQITELIEEYKNKEKIVYLGVRPEMISLDKNDVLLFDGNVDAVELLGSELNVYFYVNENKFISKLNTRNLIRSNDKISLYASKNDLFYFDAISGESILLKDGSYEK